MTALLPPWSSPWLRRCFSSYSVFTEYVLQTSVQEAARLVRTGQAQEQKLTSATFKNKICDLASIIIDCQGKVNVYMQANTNFSTLASSVPSYLNVGPAEDGTPGPNSFVCGKSQETVALIATYDWNFVVPYFMSFMGNRNGKATRRMAGFAMFRNEPFPDEPGKTCV
jgi:Flp pilus assembly protein TadG